MADISHTSGNVGIGTSTPAAPLSVCVAAGGGLEIVPTSTYAISQAYNRATGQYIENVLRGSVFSFYTGQTNTERLRITSTGDVGIGTTTPTAKLDVNGGIKFTGTIDYSNAPIGSIINFEVNEITEQTTVQQAAGGTATRTFKYTPKKATSKIYYIPLATSYSNISVGLIRVSGDSNQPVTDGRSIGVGWFHWQIRGGSSNVALNSNTITASADVGGTVSVLSYPSFATQSSSTVQYNVGYGEVYAVITQQAGNTNERTITVSASGTPTGSLSYFRPKVAYAVIETA